MNTNHYPLRENAIESLRAASGRPLVEITPEGVEALTMADVQISAETLRAQAEVARARGYAQLAANLTRAAELTAVPNAEILRMYDLLRPGRASHAELLALAELLEHRYAALECGQLVREAADVYQARGRLRF